MAAEEKGGYRLIAFDMDGTLLTSQKRISDATAAAIGRAFDAGREVVLATGRCMPELEEHVARLPRLRYAICESGAMVYDVRGRRAVYSRPIPVEDVRRILAACREERPLPMIHVLTEESVVEADKVLRMAEYGMRVYRPMFERVTHQVADIFAWYGSHPAPVEKLNLYHTTLEGRERTRRRLCGLPLALVDSEATSLECTVAGVTKGAGLEWLCSHLGIPLAQAIAVGDADNDLPMLRAAGLALAMGNANAAVRAACGASVADNDHDGCAEAIMRYLL